MTKITNKYWYLFILYTLLALITNAGMVYGGYRLSSVLEGVFASDMQGVINDTIIVLGSFIIAIFFHYFSQLVIVYTTKKLNIKLKMFIAAKINSLSDQEFIKYKKGDFISWFTNDVNSIGTMIFSSTFRVIDGITSVVLSTYAVFSFHWIIGLSLFGITILMIILPGIVQGIVSKKAQQMSKAQEEFSDRIENLLNGYTLFSYANEKRIFNKLMKAANLKVETSVASYGNYNSLQQMILFSLMIASQCIMMFVTIFLSLKGVTEKGAMLSVTNISGTYFQGVNSLFGSLFTFKAGLIIFKKFKFEKENTNYSFEITSFKKLEITNLSYKLESKTIFENLDLVIENNEKYLIVGESGRGKTTLLNLIFGLIENYEGNVKLNDSIDYRYLNKLEIKNLISYVPQESIVFNDTIRNNLSLFRESITDEKILKVIHTVNLDNWFQDKNLDTIINKSVKNISGGELQKIALARAILQDKPIIILDEITANLDQKNREIIENLLFNLSKTILLISHTSKIDNQKGFKNVIAL
ncbi:ABC transporter ATP-binding protein [Spiroplasma helicoides]|uniref:ABC transporter ATP-binding protein n=1 Tax=Spiroplasma helicoides TaxID=216938 RepID=A0A1B3SLN4_9MOLU|nr:ABC transporter ATP-binding protein [Spiroplasma helicoides]AOG60842.1 ABC transporter ATP-binding protein [Spiroplasma helicoides]